MQVISVASVVLFLTCTGTNAHDGIESDALLHVFPQVSQEMLPVGLHLAANTACYKLQPADGSVAM